MKYYVNFKKYNGFNPEPAVKAEPVRPEGSNDFNEYLVYSVSPMHYIITDRISKDDFESAYCEIDERLVDKRLAKALNEWPVDKDQDWYKKGYHQPPYRQGLL